jgi:hypothetical protein
MAFHTIIETMVVNHITKLNGVQGQRLMESQMRGREGHAVIGADGLVTRGFANFDEVLRWLKSACPFWAFTAAALSAMDKTRCFLGR